jgi:hypothetical protein
MVQPQPKSRRLGWIVLALIAVAGLLLFLDRDPEAPTPNSASRAPETLTPEPGSETFQPTPGTGQPAGGETDPPAIAQREEAQPPSAGSMQADLGEDEPTTEVIAGAGSGEDDDPGVAKAEEELALARTLEAIQAGIRSARANPGLPPEVIEELERDTPVPFEISEAVRQVNSTPPEIMEGMRQSTATPPEIAQAIAEAQEQGTSDAMRAYMAGEIDERPEY